MALQSTLAWWVQKLPCRISLDDRENGPSVSLPSVSLPSVSLPTWSSIKSSIKFPSVFSNSKPEPKLDPEPVSVSNPVQDNTIDAICDPKKQSIIDNVDAVLKRFAELIISSKISSIIEQYEKIGWFKLILENAKTSTITFQDSMNELNKAIQKLEEEIDSQIKENPAQVMLALLTNATGLCLEITEEKIKINASNTIKSPYEKPINFLNDYPIPMKISDPCKKATLEISLEKELSDLLIIAGIIIQHYFSWWCYFSS